MQQLSSRDCDKWLSMTLTMKDRFSSAWRGGRKMGRQKEMREREIGRGRGKQLEGSVASVPSRVYWLRK